MGVTLHCVTEGCRGVRFVALQMFDADTPQAVASSMHVVECSRCRTQYCWNFVKKRWDAIPAGSKVSLDDIAQYFDPDRD